jgi:hypothetical protein
MTAKLPTFSIRILGLIFAGCGDITNLTTPGSTTTEGITYLTKGTAAIPNEYPLYAGQHWLVGNVLVWHSVEYEELCVRYELSQDVLDEGWRIYETHLAVGHEVGDIPQTKKGNPIPGQFLYGDDELEGEESWEICIPFGQLGVEEPGDLDVECGNELVIAAHAVVKKLGGLEGLDLILPDQAYLCIDSQPGPNGYFGATISGGTVLDGFYDGYCIDTGSYIDDTFCDWVNIYSSYEELPTGLVDYPENLDLVNYIMNQDYIGKTSSCDGAYTPGDVQWAIWQLVDSNPSAGCCAGPWEQCRVDEILADAAANGEGYEPVCGEKAVVLLVPTEGIQPIIIMVDVPCEGDETAWGAEELGEIQFSGKNWATYFTYEIACEEVLIDTVTVSSDGTQVCSVETLVSGQEYRLEASGTYTYNTAGDWADAEWYLKNSVIVKGDSEGSQPYVLDISINGFSINIDWGEYNSAHIYSQPFTGTGSPICFSIYDSAYSDNSGSLTVDIYLVP